MHVTLPLKTAVNLLRGYLGMEVTVTYKDHAGYAGLIRYAQGLHTKCDEIGKERDEQAEYANAVMDALAEERDEAQADAITLAFDNIDLEAERDEAREWARWYYRVAHVLEDELHQATCLDGQCPCWDEED